MNLDQYFRRPKTYPEITADRHGMIVKRALDAGKIRQVKFNLYYRQGWWERLGSSKWTVRDAMTFLALAIGKRVADGPEALPVGVDLDSGMLRREARFLRKVSEVTHGIAEELDRRAELLDLEENSQTETVD
jgi:hypothetical protein